MTKKMRREDYKEFIMEIRNVIELGLLFMVHQFLVRVAQRRYANCFTKLFRYI